MDLLFSRYANPFLFLDNLIICGELSKGLHEISEIIRDEQLFQMYLHCSDGVMDEEYKYHFFPPKSFHEWKESVMASQDTNGYTEEVDIEATKAMAQDILDSFVPPGKEVNNGTI
ncbi:MAG: hypothetical protein RR219_08500 [Clostridiales bacterium]